MHPYWGGLCPAYKKGIPPFGGIPFNEIRIMSRLEIL
jgi:hypothetical protein